MKIIFRILALASLALLIPAGSIVSAATFGDVVFKIVDLLDSAFLMLLTFVVFFIAYAIYKYLIASNDSKAKQEGARLITWGVIGLTVISSVWGIVSIVSSTFFSSSDLARPGSAKDIIDDRLRPNL